MKILCLYGFLVFLFSCSAKVKRDEIPYKVIYKQLDADTAITSAVFSNGYFLCVQANHKLAVFDSGYKRVRRLEDSLNVFPISFIYKNGDTAFLTQDEPDRLGYPEAEFYFTNKFKVEKRKYLLEPSNWPVNSRAMYQDTVYDVYANNIGQYGCLVFFRNKSTLRTYATWSWSPRQIVKVEKGYLIVEEGNYQVSPGFRKVADPTKLIAVSQLEAEKLCILYQHLSVSSGKDYEILGDSIRKSGLAVYGGFASQYNVPVYTFLRNNSLFTIVNNDSSINLVTHKDDSLLLVQPILDRSIEMRRWYYDTANKKHIITFEASGGKMIDSAMQQYSNFGFIIVKDSTIDILQYYTHRVSTD
ncbi:hypothetical protein [Paraflavitalea sp. CAU 1676]|uniref:hypothetical protein n=1 Tax=Paraflavitalea sp. CAU 1676 TaxID=3032598 RepID=UPI0023DC0175|nr:hypothetical protein [Paraflavitalea sp. CAU 1676]MDF2188527.1 hypothetical protein [Paraflavitalea sp. CAU 1676]